MNSNKYHVHFYIIFIINLHLILAGAGNNEVPEQNTLKEAVEKFLLIGRSAEPVCNCTTKPIDQDALQKSKDEMMELFIQEATAVLVKAIQLSVKEAPKAAILAFWESGSLMKRLQEVGNLMEAMKLLESSDLAYVYDRIASTPIPMSSTEEENGHTEL